jgi:hypothetical protein
MAIPDRISWVGGTLGSQRQVTDVEDFERAAGLTPTMRKKLPPSFTALRLQSGVLGSFRRLEPPAGSFRQWRVKMFAGENCSKVGCFLEAALPLIAPAVALIGMLSLVA